MLTATTTTAARHEARWAHERALGERLDVANAAVRAALSVGDDREHAGQLLERAWVQMLVRDLHGRTTALGRTWEQFMVGDVELAGRVASGRTEITRSAGERSLPASRPAAPRP
jgi:hypothetical protein